MASVGGEKTSDQGLDKGLIGNILKGSPLASMGVSPQLTQKEVLIELTTEQLKALLLEKADARVKESVLVELHEGKLTLKIKLL